MSDIKEKVEGIIKKIKEFIKKEIQLISKKTGIDGKIISGILGICLILSFINLFGKYITCLVGVVLPAYWSIKAIESPEANDDKQWLTYWAIYGIFTFLDNFAGIILRIFPFYFILKLVFLVWCFMPNTLGALFIYNKIVEPLFKKYEGKIDQKLDSLLRNKKNNRINYDKEGDSIEKIGNTFK